MLRSLMQSRSEAGSTGQNEEHGTRGSRWRQQESRSRFISRKNYGRSIGKRRKRSFMPTSWQTSEENFTTFTDIPVLPNVWIRTAMQSLKSWQGNSWTRDRRVSIIQVFDIAGEPA